MENRILGELPPLYTKIDPEDNVSIVVNEGGLDAEAIFPDGLVLLEHVPQGHKVALSNIEKRETIMRYGQVIGYAARRRPKGSWIEESSVALPEAPDLDSLPLTAYSRKSSKACSSKATGTRTSP
jgi:galactarate dehydratase